MALLRDIELYRPGAPAQSLRLALAREDDGGFSIAAEMLAADPAAPAVTRRALGRIPEAEALARFESTIEQHCADGFQAAGLPLPPVPAQPAIPRALIARIAARLAPEQWRLLSSARRARLAWRIGELRLAPLAAQLMAVLGSDDARLDYAIVWALGRSGDTAHAGTLDQLAQNAASEPLRRLARVAWFELATADARAAYAQACVADWPAALRNLWPPQDRAARTELRAAAANPDTWARWSRGEWLEQLDLVARVQPAARTLLLEELRDVPLAAGSFRAVRRLYKSAELREDGEVWALIARRFEQTPGNFSSRDTHFQLGRKWVRAADELARADSRLAYSARTRGYFLRRNWRHLRRLGAVGSGDFAPLAFHALMQFDDARAPAARATDRHVYQDGMWRTITRHWHAYSDSLLYHRLLHRPGGALKSGRSGVPWWTDAPVDQARATREEPFTSSWDMRPDLLVRLLLEARAQGVHAFAARALEGNTTYLASLDDAVWLRLVNSAFEVTARFALARLRERIDAETDTARRIAWLVMLVRSRHQDVWRAALAWITDDPARYAGSAELVCAMFTARAAEVRRQGRLLAQAAVGQAGVARQVADLLLAWLEAANPGTEDLDAICADVAWALANPLREAAREVDHARLIALLGHACAAVQIAAVDWLLLHREPVAKIPVPAYQPLLQADDPAVQAAGVKLFAALPDAVLAQQAELVARFCAAAAPEVRAAARPAVDRLVPVHAEFARALTRGLIDALFRAERAEHVHAHLIGLLVGPLVMQTREQPDALVLRLLLARSKGAQRLGEWLLESRRDEVFTTPQWAQLGRHDAQVVRMRAIGVLRQRLAANATVVNEVLPVLATRWDDSREAALAMLRECVPAPRWQREQIVALCDHLHPAVQAFGRELATPRLASEDAPALLAAIAEHPSLRMQQFVAESLRTAVGRDAARLGALTPFCLTVLSQVNRGRRAKAQVQAVLRELAQQSEAMARAVCALFERCALSVAVVDRAQYIAGLYEIRARYPAIAHGLNVLAPEARAGAR